MKKRDRYEEETSDKISEYRKDGKPIIYLDESGFAYDIPYTHGYAVK